MSELRQTTSEKTKENRPSLSESSLRTYVSTLANLHSKHLKGSSYSIDYFSDSLEATLDYLKDTAPSSRKSVLSALCVLASSQKCRDRVTEDCKVVSGNYKSQVKSEKEEANWITTEEIKAKYDGL